MSRPLSVLILEDRGEDAELILHELRRAGFELNWRRVENEQDYLAHLDDPLDLIIADYSLPQFDAPRALQLLEERGLEIPCIVVTGSIGEEKAVELIKEGAADYLLKDRLARLGQAVTLVLRQTTLRREKRQAEENLRASEANFRQLFASNPQSMWVYDLETLRFLEVNEAAINHYGYTRDEFLAMTIADIRPEEDVERLMANLDSERGPLQKSGAWRHRLRDGSLIWVEINSHALDFAGRKAVLVTVYDITARREAEREVNRLRYGVERSGEAIFLTDTQGRITYANPSFERIYGYARHEIIGKTPSTLKSDVTPAERHAAFWEALLGKQIVIEDITNRTKDGRLIEVESTANAILDEHGEITGFIAIQRDVTDRKQADESLRRYAKRMEVLHRIDYAILSGWTPEQVMLDVMERMQQLVPFDRATLSTFDFQTGEATILATRGVKVPGVVAGFRFRLENIDNLSDYKKGLPYTVADFARLPHRNSLEESLYSHGLRSFVAMPMFARGELIGGMSLSAFEPDTYQSLHLDVLREIADQLAIAIQHFRFQEEIQRHTEHLEALVDDRTREITRIRDRLAVILNNSPDPILLLKLNGKIDASNPAFSSLFGYREDEVYNQPIIVLVAPAHAAMLAAALDRVIVGEAGTRLEIVAKRSDGQTFDAEVALAPVRDDGTVNIVVTIRDITGVKEVQRMKDAFVSNVSHELRTPISSLKLYQHLLTANPAKQESYTESIRREVLRLEHTVEDMLTLSRLDQGRISLRTDPVDLSALAEGYVSDRAPLAESRNLSLTLRVPATLPPVHGDEGLIGQTLSILLTNALNYTPPGGAILVETHPGPSGLAGLTISDTGPGIPPDERDRLFERFFRGEASRTGNVPGTGLGLSIAQEIATRHGGRIEVYSIDAPHDPAFTGARFTVWLPTI